MSDKMQATSNADTEFEPLTRFIPKQEVADFIDLVRRGRREIGFDHPVAARSGELTQLEGVLKSVVNGARGHINSRQMGRLETEINLIRKQLRTPAFQLKGDAPKRNGSR